MSRIELKILCTLYPYTWGKVKENLVTEIFRIRLEQVNQQRGTFIA